MLSKRFIFCVPERIVVVSLIATILGGVLLLALPISRTHEIPLLDLLFTAVSATCVTGLFTISLDNFTGYGQAVILALIQIGGLGLITLTTFLVSLFVELGLATQVVTGHILEIGSWHHVRRTILFIIKFTLAVELVGTAFVFATLSRHYTAGRALFVALFHSVSSFCNAGISLFCHSSENHILGHNYPILIVTALLAFAGSFGFITWIETLRALPNMLARKRVTYSLQTRIVASSTFLLIVFPALIIWLLEYNHAFANMDLFESWFSAFFNSINLRSTGFFNVPVYYFKTATLMMMVFVAFIGASPASTGSGVRITTFVLYLSAIKAALRGLVIVNIRGRRIAQDQLFKSVAIIASSIFFVMVITFALLITEPSLEFADIVLESLSAFTNIGISNGTTERLGSAGKMLIALGMIVGRIGSLTLWLALRRARIHQRLLKCQGVYPEERVMLS